jgi:uncharacterized SAM-binding protein YcdF (DUF218 family)
MTAAVKEWLIPGSMEFLIAGTVLASLLLSTPYQRLRSWGRALVIVLGASYLLMSVPLVADGLVAVSAAGFLPVQASDVQGAGAVVILDGGARQQVVDDQAIALPAPATIFRAFEAVRVYRLLPHDAWVVVTAGGYGAAARQDLEGAALHDQLVRGGIPAGRIVVDTTSRNTVEHARFLRGWIEQQHVSRFVLVTSATHVRRARMTLQAVGLDPIVSPAPMRSDSRRSRFWPEAGSIEISRQAIYDFLGLAYYMARGWA